MVKKITKAFLIVLLVLMPFTNLINRFSPYRPGETIVGFILASVAYAVLSIAAMSLIIFLTPRPKALSTSGVLMFFVGLLFTPALMIGPPEISPGLLNRVSEEHLRFGILFVSSTLFTLSIAVVIIKQWNLSLTGRLMVIPLLTAASLLTWDNITSYYFSDGLSEWVIAGNDGSTFFSQYNFHNFERTLGRSLLYLITIWLVFILWKQNMPGKAALIAIAIFCAIGLTFFFIYNFVDLAFYSPFMIPAIAMTPGYWCGLVMLFGDTSAEAQSVSESQWQRHNQI